MLKTGEKRISTHVQNLIGIEPGFNRAEAVKRVSSRFYVDEPTALVRNGLSTDLLCSPSDLQPLRRNVLTEKIHDAMEYATAFTDVEELNALQYLPTTAKRPDYYLTLGLFLYFEDEASRHAPVHAAQGHSFQAALRNARMSLDIDDKPDSEQLYERCVKALSDLGMDEPKYKAILQQWKQSGTYMLEGEMHAPHGDGEVKGTYAELARQICQRQKYLGMNLAVSYALGNKEHVCSMNADDAFAMARQATRTPAIIESRIKHGFDMREELIITKMVEAVRQLPDQNALAAHHSISRAKEILSWVPDAALEILDHERYICSYADASTIEKNYPKDDLPGLPHDVEKDVRGNKGQWLKRYRTIFLSNGYRQKHGDIDASSHLKSMVAAQTLLHETMHLAINALPDDKYNQLQKEISLMAIQLREHRDELPAYFNQYLQTIDTNTLFEVLNDESRLYKNYSNQWEEVACNMYGLMHTEFDINNPSIPHSPFRDGVGSVDLLKKTSDHIEELVNEALASYRANPQYTAGEDRLLHAKLGRC